MNLVETETNTFRYRQTIYDCLTDNVCKRIEMLVWFWPKVDPFHRDPNLIESTEAPDLSNRKID